MGLPVAFATGVVGIIYGDLGDEAVNIVPTRIFGLTNYLLDAIPCSSDGEHPRAERNIEDIYHMVTTGSASGQRRRRRSPPAR
jgi:hypothetical protein